jgi:hypothetical protein
MTPDITFEQYCAYVTTLDKKSLIERLLHFEGPIKLDFTAEYLGGLDTDKLRHILLAAVVTVEQKKAAKGCAGG